MAATTTRWDGEGGQEDSEQLLSFPRDDSDDLDNLRGSDTKAAIFNLLTSVIGGGTLTIPFVMQSAGLGLGVVLFVVIGVCERRMRMEFVILVSRKSTGCRKVVGFS
eukprot:TRINITY_DN6429_c0_g1_i1.p1 TRINITY_DN6429_c0_g1~~TRINITY_DN6429_c0_g1_i1.p1  ORF type:complete len:107 (+),score=18.27 TRINITY_DN6429_c0_g1_i1:190-510(+)